MPDFLDIVGQDAALTQLQRALAGGRRPHAYLFVGPEGVGRRTTAVEFARILLCENPLHRPNAGRLGELPDDLPLRRACGACPSCRTIQAGTSGELHLVHKALARYHEDPAVRQRKMQELGIDVIRQFVLAPASLTSSGRGKVFIVRQAELMSTEAQNALLKTLEEPPPGVSLILMAHSAGELLPTTRSRCQPIRFGPLPAEFVTAKLVDSGVGNQEAAFLARYTDGSIGRSLRAAQEKLYELKRPLVAAATGLAAGGEADLAEMLQEAMKTQGAKNTRAEDLESAEEPSAPAEVEMPDAAGAAAPEEGKLAATLANRLAGQSLLSLLVSVYRDALGIACQADRPLVHADQAGQIQSLASRHSRETLANILEQLARYESLLWRNVNVKLLWDNVAITCAGGAPAEV